MTDHSPSCQRSREARTDSGNAPLGPVDFWRGLGGPDQWQQAWERTITELGPVRAARQEDRYDPYQGRWTEGAAGLALAYYLLAVTLRVPVEAVAIDEVRALAVLPDTGSAWPAVARFDALLDRAGHRLDAPDDPVAACWRNLRVDCSPTPPYSEWEEVDWATRWGADKVVSLSVVLDRLANAGAVL
jgi:hypothetical protein